MRYVTLHGLMYNIKITTYEISTAFAKYWRCCAHLKLVTQRICNVTSTNFTNTFGTLLYFGLTRSSLSFVKLDLLLQELLPFGKIYFSRLFHGDFWDFDLKQIKFLQELLPFGKIYLSRLFHGDFWDFDLKQIKFLQELLPFGKIYLSRLFHGDFWDFDLKQIKFHFICFCRSNAS